MNKQEDRKAIEPKEYAPTRYSKKLYGCGRCKRELEGRPDKCPSCGAKVRWAEK